MTPDGAEKKHFNPAFDIDSGTARLRPGKSKKKIQMELSKLDFLHFLIVGTLGKDRQADFHFSNYVTADRERSANGGVL
jgi:hypothetical protein